jgi:hypothetical protein
MQYFQMHLLAQRFVFVGWTSGFFWKRKPRPIKWHQYRPLTRRLFFRLHICSLGYPQYMNQNTPRTYTPVSCRISWSVPMFYVCQISIQTMSYRPARRLPY